MSELQDLKDKVGELEWEARSYRDKADEIDLRIKSLIKKINNMEEEDD